tara:strand:- start:3683 stop:3910 length:228 start_codon:yes stop_codon:yes gene_type:complete
MVSHKHHKVFIGITSVIVLVLGLLLGAVLAVNLEIVDLEIINIGLTFTSIILLLIVGGLLLEVKEMINSKTRGKR